MLIAESHWKHAERAMDTVVVLAPSLRAQLVRRHRLLFDTRFAAPLGAPRPELATVFLVREGHVLPDGGAQRDGPQIWLLRDDELEHTVAGARTLRSWGAPTTVMTLRMPTRAVAHAIGIAEGSHAMSRDVVDAMAALGAPGDVAHKRAAFRGVLDGLVRSGLLVDDEVRALGTPEPVHLTRVWSVLASIYAREETSATIDLVSTLAKVSWRQAHRDLDELCRSVGFDGFRATTRALRLRRAITLLSAVELSIVEVAKHVGYGSTDAMGRAFRDAALPPPSVVRDAVAYVDD